MSSRLDGPLRSAANNGEVAKVRDLLARGADPGAIGKHGDSALHTAVRFGRHAIVEAILDAGANPTAPNAQRETPLTLAAMHSDVRMVGLLLGTGAAHSERDLARALCWAIIHTDEAMTAALLAGGANVNARDSQGRTVYSIAKWWHDQAIESRRPPYGRMLELLRAPEAREKSRSDLPPHPTARILNRASSDPSGRRIRRRLARERRHETHESRFTGHATARSFSHSRTTGRPQDDGWNPTIRLGEHPPRPGVIRCNTRGQSGDR